MEIARGKTLYRDVWFDKPPLVAWIALAWGARAGVALRLAGAAYAIAVAWMCMCFARAKWGEREGLLAALFAAWFLTFGLPSAVIPLASDMLLVLPHVVAIYFAWRGRAFWSGVGGWRGIAGEFESDFRSRRVHAVVLAIGADAAVGIRRAQRDRARLDVAARLGRRILPASVAMGIDLRVQYIRRQSCFGRIEADRGLGSGSRSRWWPARWSPSRAIESGEWPRGLPCV